jgi:hypothetical protein
MLYSQTISHSGSTQSEKRNKILLKKNLTAYQRWMIKRIDHPCRHFHDMALLYTCYFFEIADYFVIVDESKGCIIFVIYLYFMTLL